MPTRSIFDRIRNKKKRPKIRKSPSNRRKYKHKPKASGPKKIKRTKKKIPVSKPIDTL